MMVDILVEDADGSASCIDMSPLLLEVIASNIVSKESPYVLIMGQLVRETGDRYTTLGASKSSTGSVERNAEDDDVKNGDGCSSSSLGAPAWSVARGAIVYEIYCNQSLGGMGIGEWADLVELPPKMSASQEYATLREIYVPMSVKIWVILCHSTVILEFKDRKPPDDDDLCSKRGGERGTY